MGRRDWEAQAAPPHSNANELQPGRRRRWGEKEGLEVGWVPRPPGRRLSPPPPHPRAGLKVPRTVCRSRWHQLSTLHAMVSPLAVSNCLRSRKGVPQNSILGPSSLEAGETPPCQTLSSAGVRRGPWPVPTRPALVRSPPVEQRAPVLGPWREGGPGVPVLGCPSSAPGGAGI